MLKKRKPSNDDVNLWLQKIGNKFGFPVQRVSPDHWQLGMHNRAGPYTMDIKDKEPWFSYGVRLTHGMEDMEEKKRADFLGEVLDLNGEVNGVRIGRQDGDLTLTREEPKEDLNPLLFGRSILTVHLGHEVILPELLKRGKKHGVKFKKE